MTSLIVYPSWGQMNLTAESGYNLPIEADIKSIKFTKFVPYKVIPVEGNSLIYKANTRYSGKIVELNDKTVTLEIEDKATVTIKNYDVIKIIPYKNLLEYNSSKTEQFSFSINEVNSEIFYTFDLNQKLIQQTASITLPFSFGGDVSLMVGAIKMEQPTEKWTSRRSLATSSPQINSSSAVENIGEYKNLQLNFQQLNRGTNIITINKFSNVDWSQLYIHDLERTEVHFVYIFNAPDFLAAGYISVYEKQKLTGKSSIKEHQKSTRTKVNMGATTRIVAETKLNRQKVNESLEDYDIDFSTKLDNRTGGVTDFELEYYVGNGKVSNVKSLPTLLIENNKIIIPFKLKPGKTVYSGSFHLKM